MRNPASRTTMLGVVGVVVLLAVTSAFGQTVLKANIPFAFTVAGKTLPAGQYNFVRESNDEVIRVASAAKGPGVLAVVITRLGGGIHTSPEDAHIVFDKVGEKYFLSELWVPGMDGFMMHTTKGPHEHRAVHVPVQ